MSQGVACGFVLLVAATALQDMTPDFMTALISDSTFDIEPPEPNQLLQQGQIQELESLLVLGSGPAGLSAAIYAARANLQPLVVSHDDGQLSTTGTVENFPSCTWNASGSEIMSSFKDQAVQFGTRFLQGNVTQLETDSPPYTMHLKGGRTVQFKAIIIASGASSKWLGLPGELKYFNKGVAACATCDGWFFRNKATVVIGGGDTAMETALFLSRICTRVTLIHRRNSFSASRIMAHRAEHHPKITILWNSSTLEFGGDGTKLTHVRVSQVGPSGLATELRVATDGAFVAIGHEPNTKMLAGTSVELDSAGYIKTAKGEHTATSVEGVFAAGDVADRVYRQAITSAGTGAMAAMDAERHLCHMGC